MAERKKRSVVMPEIEKPDLNVKEELPVDEIGEEVVRIENTLLFERIPQYRFVDENGRMFRLELRSSGVYWLYPV
jgi:hypothetical protein